MNSQLERGDSELLQTFVALADTLVDDFDLIELLHLLTSRAVAYTSADEAGVVLADEIGALKCLAASTERTRLLELFEIQNAEGPCRDCVIEGTPIQVDDLASATDRWPHFVP